MKLADAIRANDPDEVRKSLKRVKNVNRELQDCGLTPLQLAADAGSHLVVPLLVESGAKPQDNDLTSALHRCAQNGDMQIWRVLNERLDWSKESRTSAARVAIENDHVDLVKSIVDEDADDCPEDALHQAARLPATDMLKCLLVYATDVNASAGHSGERYVPIHAAADSCGADAVQILLDHGANVNERTNIGQTPLMRAMDSCGVWQYLDESERTAAIEACCKTLDVLISAGADGALVDDAGNDALGIYEQDAEFLDERVVNRLQKAGAVGQGPDGALMQSVLSRDVDGIKASLASGANPNWRESHPRGATPLTIAARSEQMELVEMLLDAGADPDQPDSGETPLMAAAIAQSVDIARILLDRGADPNQPNPKYVGRDGGEDDTVETPLTFAKSMGYRQIEQILREAGAVMPEPTRTALAAGVHWWDDWDQIVARGDVPTVAEALARLIGGRVVDVNWSDMITPGERSFVVVRARGLNWTNLLPVTPNALGHDRFDLDTLKQLAEQLSNESGAETIWACFGDTAGAAGWTRFQPSGQRDEDDGWDEDLLADVVEAMEEAGEDVPEHMARRLAEMQDADEPGPDSTERLEQLAQTERFALAWEFFNVREADDFDLEFAKYPVEAFEDVAFVTT